MFLYDAHVVKQLTEIAGESLQTVPYRLTITYRLSAYMAKYVSGEATVTCHECDLEFALREGQPDRVDNDKGEWRYTSVNCPRCLIGLVESVIVVEHDTPPENWFRGSRSRRVA